MEELAAAKSEVPSAVDQVGAEQAAEEHDFGGEEDPHAQVGGIALLLLGGEVVQERGIGRVVASRCLEGG